MCLKECTAEAIAAFILVFAGAGTVLAGGSRLEISLAHGLALMAGVYAVAHISGAHINPAVTVAMWSAKKIKSKMAVSYIIAQLAGAAIAGYVLLYAFGSPAASVNNLGAGITMAEGIVLEAILTAILVFIVFATAVHQKMENAHVGLVLGGYLAAAHLVALGLTGASLNPARTFGPALASGMWANHAVYWVGPIIGALVAAYIYKNVFATKGKK